MSPIFSFLSSSKTDAEEKRKKQAEKERTERIEQILKKAQKVGVQVSRPEVEEYLNSREEQERSRNTAERLTPAQRSKALETHGPQKNAYLRCQGWTEEQLETEMHKRIKMLVKVAKVDPVNIKRISGVLKEAKNTRQQNFDEKDFEKRQKAAPKRRK